VKRLELEPVQERDGQPVLFNVLHLPPWQTAQIVRRADTTWNLERTRDGFRSIWGDPFPSAEDALEFLQQQVDAEDPG
jgi:hypothetical protein